MTRFLNARLGLAAAWLGTLVLGSVLQFHDVLPSGTFPEFRTYFPDFPGISLEPVRAILPVKPETDPAAKNPTADQTPDKPGPGADSAIKTPPNVPLAKKELWNRNKDQYLAGVLTKLRAQKQTVRIVHMGDSILWAETVTATLRRSLQQKYGNGGRGYVSLQDTSETTLKDHTNETRGGFTLHSIPFDFYRGTPRAELGFFGRTFEPQSSQAQSIHKTQIPFEYARVFLRASDKAAVRAETRLGQAPAKSFREEATGPCAEVRIQSEADQIKLQFDGKPLVDGVFLERSSGVAYSVVVRMGIHQTWMRHIPAENQQCAWKLLEPDLVIFQFALNESATIDTGLANYTAQKYTEDLRAYMKELRTFLPSTPILMIGPVERIKDKDGVLLPVPAQMAVRDAQKQIASEFNVLFFDPTASSETPAPAAMMARGMLLSDYLHLSPAGGEFLGSLVFRETFGGTESAPDSEAQPQAAEAEKPSTTITFPSARYAWFLLLVLGIFSLTRRLPWFRLVFVTIASCYFYASWEAWALGLLLFSCSLDFTMGRLIEGQSRRGVRFALLCVSLLVNVSLLIFFKYFTFLARSINALLDPSSQIPVYQVLLPPGISFYTFQSLSYTIDVYRGEMKAEKNPLRLFFFVSYFPQLVAGPIVRAHDFLRDMRKNVQHFQVSTERFQEAVFLIARGLTKKIAADWLALNCVDRVIQNPAMFTSAEILVAFYAYALQIYGDFSGYTDIATGSARLFGLRLTLNFHRPYQSASITEFWRRWHISLGSWFRDYLYISLGGNRTGVYRNLFITMAVAGIWHGAGWNFLLWGLFYGFMLMFERATGIDRWKSGPVMHALRVFGTFHLVLAAWVLFRVGSFETFTALMNGISKLEFHAPNVSWTAVVVMAAGFAIHLTPMSWINRASRIYGRMHWSIAGILFAVCTVILSKAAVQHAVPFIYFQF